MDNQEKKINIYVMAGVIGVGKTTICNELCKRHSNFYYLPEPQIVDPTLNEILVQFYKSMDKYSFTLQKVLLRSRIASYLNAIDYIKTSEKYDTIISDRSIYEDLIFCKVLKQSGNMSESEYETYKNLRKSCLKDIPKPTKLFFLKASAKLSYERIINRGRECEKNISFDYLFLLTEEYNKFFSDEDELEIMPIVDVINYGDNSNYLKINSKIDDDLFF